MKPPTGCMAGDGQYRNAGTPHMDRVDQVEVTWTFEFRGRRIHRNSSAPITKSRRFPSNRQRIDRPSSRLRYAALFLVDRQEEWAFGMFACQNLQGGCYWAIIMDFMLRWCFTIPIRISETVKNGHSLRTNWSSSFPSLVKGQRVIGNLSHS